MQMPPARPHAWHVFREHVRPEGVLKIERCKHCNAGRITTTARGQQTEIVTHPHPLPPICLGTHESEFGPATVRL